MGKDDDINFRDHQVRAKQTGDFADFIAEATGQNVQRLRLHTERETPRAEQQRQQQRASQQFQQFSFQQRLQLLRDRLEQMDRLSLETLKKAESELKDVRSRAATDDQGRRMYRTADGRTAFYEDGTEVGKDVQQRTDWTGKPAWETFKESNQELQAAQERRRQVQQAQQEAANGNLSPDELRGLEASVEKMDSAPDDVLAALGGPRSGTSAAREYMGADEGAPSSKTAFNRAGSGEAPAEQPRLERSPPRPKETLTL